MKIALDVLGGDLAPMANIEGAIAYLNECGDSAAELILVGDEKKIESALNQKLDIIFCIGETFKEKISGKTFSVLKHQTIGTGTPKLLDYKIL